MLQPEEEKKSILPFLHPPIPDTLTVLYIIGACQCVGEEVGVSLCLRESVGRVSPEKSFLFPVSQGGEGKGGGGSHRVKLHFRLLQLVTVTHSEIAFSPFFANFQREMPFSRRRLLYVCMYFRSDANVFPAFAPRFRNNGRRGGGGGKGEGSLSHLLPAFRFPIHFPA